MLKTLSITVIVGLGLMAFVVTRSQTFSDKALCIKAAIAARDNSLIASYARQADDEISIYQLRKEALKNIWQISNPKTRAEALRDLNQNFSESVRLTTNNLRASIKQVTDQYREAREDCNVTPAEDGLGN